MNKRKQKRLEASGWKVGSVDEFLNLTPEELAYVELKIKLAESLSRCRKEKRLTQVQLARRLHSSQSRVAKLEAGDPSVSLDLLIRSHLALGATSTDLAHIIGGPGVK
ncbi:MAG: helix-turn-helix transcriptional regulator [bacterium]|nr:helix-turn-helix transcriptional regulator [bacterium]